jgi:hypothetical protein
MMEDENCTYGKQIPDEGHEYNHNLHHFEDKKLFGLLVSNIHRPFVKTFNSESHAENCHNES